MTSYNHTVLVGNATRDPELKTTTSGKSVCTFDLAVNHTYKDKSGKRQEQTAFIPLTLWDRQAEVTAEYVRKGRLIMVDGRLEQDRWEDKDGNKKSRLKLNVKSIVFLDQPKEKESKKIESEDENAQ